MSEGTFACPICGKDSPHQHSNAEVQQWRDTELWVERSWQDFRAMMDAALTGDFKPPLTCGCEDENGQPDPHCPFCGHPDEAQEKSA